MDSTAAAPYDTTPETYEMPEETKERIRQELYGEIGAEPPAVTAPEPPPLPPMIKQPKTDNVAPVAQPMSAVLQPSKHQPQGVQVHLRSLDSVEVKHIEWEWEDRIPRGKVTVLVGDPGGGKSYLTLAIARGVTWGLPLPGDSRSFVYPGDVVLLNFEDGAADTIRPRADACKVRTERLHLIQCDRNGEEMLFSLDHLAQLEAAMDRLPNPRMVIIDPIASLLGGVDTAKDAKVRTALTPLVQFAERRNVAVLAVMHLNKSEATKALYRVGGSIGFVGFARSVLLVGVDEESGRRSIVPIKHNLAARAKPIEFNINDTGFSWIGESDDLGAEKLLGIPAPKNSRVADAKAFLLELLKEGPIPASEVFSKGEQSGFAVITLKRADKELGIVHTKTATGWTWTLPLELAPLSSRDS